MSALHGMMFKVRVTAPNLLLWLTLAAVLVAVSLPGSTLAWMRHRWDWFTYPLDVIESAGSAVNLVHAILFLFLGMAVRISAPSWQSGRVLFAFSVLSIATGFCNCWFLAGTLARPM